MIILILVFDVGNTNTVIGCFNQDALVFTSRIATDNKKTADEYASLIRNILLLNEINKEDIKGSVISSVVPTVQYALKNAVKILCDCKIIEVGPGVKTGINIKIDNPNQLGADLVCSAVYAINSYKAPIIVFDLGTATTITAIDKDNSLIGGSIMPGIKTSLEALSNVTAQLPHINLEGETPFVIGKNTIDSMRSGAILGNACMIDGMIERYKQILGEDATVIITGGISKSIIPHLNSEVIYNEFAILEGLKLIYHKNDN